MKEKRMHLPESLRNHFSQIISRRLIETSFFKTARTIAFYSSTFGEVLTESMLEFAMSHQKSCYFPVLHENRLAFIQVHRHMKMKANRFGILEPAYDEKRLLSPHELDLVILPLVAFDEKGHRLGMGGGFYDRTFGFKNRKKGKPWLVGAAYDFQKLPQVPRSNLDVLLDMVVTDKKVYVI
jgi:5-formyltetrahydrofolate cyclo-ligase